MKRTLTGLALLLAASTADAQSLADLRADGNGGSTDHVLTYGMGYHQHRWSPLTQIDRKTIRRLVPIWNVSLSSNYGEQGQPLVYDGVMYVTNAEYTVATTRPCWPPRAACSSPASRRASSSPSNIDTGTPLWQFQS